MADPAAPTPPPAAEQDPAPDKAEKPISFDLWIIGVMVLVAVGVLIWLGYANDWTGFGLDTGPEQVPATGAGGTRIVLVQLPKRLWDWLGLLVVPLAVAGVGLLFTRQQTATERSISKRRIKKERAIALDQQRQATFDKYLDDISKLLLEERLNEDNSTGRHLARVRTLTALRQLDGRRKGAVVQFLGEGGLMKAPLGIVRLSGADLSDADLSGANLFHADLRRVDLRRSNLRGADLRGATLFRANLRGADLRGADLRGARLILARMILTRLSGADLRDADLRGADLRGAKLIGVDLINIKWTRSIVRAINLDGATTDGQPVTVPDLLALGAIEPSPSTPDSGEGSPDKNT